MFNSECRGHGYYCVLESNYTASPLIINMTRKFVHDPLKFFLCKEKCPLKWLTNGRYVIHPKRNEIVNITDSIDLPQILDHIIDGGGNWKPAKLPKLAKEGL